MDARTHYAAFIERRHFGSLDGLRCISIVAVIWSHGPGFAAKSVLLSSGRLGVDLFFAISGFLITSLLLRERRLIGDISLGRFYFRRSLRIFPLYYAVLALYVVLMLAVRHSSPAGGHLFSNLPYFLTYTSNWFVAASSPFGFAWSLATEEQFYCAWPWAVKYWGKWAPVAMAGLIGIAVASGQHWLAVTGFARVVLSQVALPICAGVLLAHLLDEERGYNVAFRLLRWRAAPLITILTALVLIALRVKGLLLAVAFALIVGSCVIREDHWLKPVLSSRGLVSVGAVSYGMYLLHGLGYNGIEIVGKLVGFDRHGLISFFLALLLTFGLARLSYRYFESFFLRLKKRFEVTAATAGSKRKWAAV